MKPTFATVIAGAILLAGGSILFNETSITDVSTAQEAYFQKTGKYLQVKPDGKTADGNAAKDELELANVPYEIHEYKMPDGEQGYYIMYDTPNGKAQMDFGNGGFTQTPPPLDTSTST